MWQIALYSLTVNIIPSIYYSAIGLLLFAGLLFDIAGVIFFRRAKTTINPLTPKATTTLVTTGIYRISRNPMYVGFIFILWAWAIFLKAPFSLLGVGLYIIYIQHFQIKPEEKALEQHFGNDFITYKNNVRRWL